MIKYVCCKTFTDTVGKVTPLSIIWEDGREYFISKVLEIKNIASTKGGGVGTRYTCKINGQTKFLFLSDYKWFVELD